jgi:hypothetical protein
MNGGMFSNYLNKLENNLEGGSNNFFSQMGSGYSVEPGVNIGNRPEINAYSDCCPPAVISNQLVHANTDSPVCAPNAYTAGGARKSRRKTKRRKQGKKSKKSRKSKSRKSKSRKSKSRKSKSRKSKSLSGGMKPFDQAFSGEVSNFDADMKNRTFDSHQPSWSPNSL